MRIKYTFILNNDEKNVTVDQTSTQIHGHGTVSLEEEEAEE